MSIVPRRNGDEKAIGYRRCAFLIRVESGVWSVELRKKLRETQF